MRNYLKLLPAACSLFLVTNSFDMTPVVAQASGAGDAAKGQVHAATPSAKIKEWFSQYDAIRRQAQMNPTERKKADALLSQGISIIIPGPEKLAAQQLLQKLVAANQQAANQLKQLSLYPETEKLHRGYYKYFTTASALFNDYLQLQDNLFAKDPKTGEPVADELTTRKQELADLDEANKRLDSELRSRFAIAPYRY